MRGRGRKRNDSVMSQAHYSGCEQPLGQVGAEREEISENVLAMLRAGWLAAQPDGALIGRCQPGWIRAGMAASSD